MAGFPPNKTFDLAATHPRPTIRAAQPDAWAAPPRLPGSSGFVPMEVLLREIGLAAPSGKGAADAPLVAPHGPDTAEFSPPRPLRRPAARFAHLSPAKPDDR